MKDPVENNSDKITIKSLPNSQRMVTTNHKTPKKNSWYGKSVLCEKLKKKNLIHGMVVGIKTL